MTSGPVVRRLVQLAWPLFTGNLLTSAYQLVDVFWVARLGTEAVAAVALAFPTVWLVFSLGLGVTTAGIALVSQAIGAGERKRADEAAGQVVVLAFVVATALAAIAIATRVPLLTAMGGRGTILDLAAAYLGIVYAGIPFTFGYFAFRAILQGAGDSLTPMKLLFFSVLLNVVLDPLWIFGIGPFPALGVAGAAWATLVSNGAATVAGIVLLFRGDRGLKLHWRQLAPRLHWIRQITAIGLPATLDGAARSVSAVVMTAIVARFGGVPLAAYGISSRVMSLVWTSAGAMEQATSTGVGQNLGAKQDARAERLAWSGAALMFGFLTTAGLILALGATQLMRTFTSDVTLVEEGARFLHIVPLSFGFWGATVVLQGGFRGAGHTVAPMCISLLTRWILTVPGMILAGHVLDGGPTGAWWAMFGANVIASVVAGLWFGSGTWKRPLAATDMTAPNDST